MYSVLQPISQPIVWPTGSPVGPLFGNSIQYPPARDKLLIWATGQIQDGAYVWQDPDEVQDPDAPFGIWRKDKQVSPVEYSMKTSASHCLDMSSTASRVDATSAVTLDAQTFDFSFQYIPSVLASVHGADLMIIRERLAASPFQSIRIDVYQPGDLLRVVIQQSDLTPIAAISTTAIVVGNTYDVRVVADGTTLSITVNGDTFSSAYDGTILTGGTHLFLGDYNNSVGGSLFDVELDGAIIPLSEGSGANVHTTDGIQMTVTLPVWGLQDDYHYNVASGFWMNGDGVKYPYAVSGFTSVHPAGKWNDAESKYEMRNETALVDSDLLETTGFWFSDHATTPVSIPRTQVEIEAHCAGKASEFVSQCGDFIQYSKYSEVLTGSELVEAQDFNCL